MTPQEKLLEYTLFELTNNGSAATLTPATQDFGSQPVGFNSAVQNFTWMNKSTFTAAVTLLTGSGDFSIAGSNPCTAVRGQHCLHHSGRLYPHRAWRTYWHAHGRL